MQYGSQQKVVFVGTTNNMSPQDNFSEVETKQYTPKTQKILAIYLSPHNNDFITDYSGLKNEDIDQINQIISLAQKQTTYTEEETRAANNIYQKLFVESVDERVQDAPSSRVNELIGTKACIAVSVISNKESDVVKDCVGEDSFPSDIQWSIDDITAVAQIVPYYLAGSYYFSLDGSSDLSNYYLRQVVLHHEVAAEQWGQEYFEEVAGDDYLNMVEDARDKLQLLNE
jgi:hypothetical protein